ncbi:MAG TPA: SCP2 sterol-binding domain-containing protein [Myxococcota bacterium]|jgi:hypothetical protein
MKPGPPADPRRFYTETIPLQFNGALDAQERLGETGRELFQAMRAVDATLCVEVRGEGGGRFYLNILAGRMTAGDAPARLPFLTVVQDRAGFQSLAREAGDSALALLGGLSGLSGELRLTRKRIESLAQLRGAVRFAVSGEGGFALITHFGDGPVPDPPNASIEVGAEAYGELRSGKLDPGEAFMNGKIKVEGDLQLAMQLALAALSPD